MSVNVLRKLFEKQNYIQQPIDTGVCGVNLRLLHAYWLNYFSHAEDVAKAIENVEIRAVYCPLFNFALC